MALLEILHFPDSRLRVKTQPIEVFDQQLSDLIDDMFETMYDAPGVGLAATQVGLTMSLAVMDCSQEQDKPEPIVMCNPEIIELDELIEVDEGCLSVPGHYDHVDRYHRVTFRAQDRHGKAYEMQAEGLLAQCVQHETGHLHGELYIDKLSRLKRSRIRKKLEKQARAQAKNAGQS